MTPMQRLAGVGQVPGSALIVSGFLRVFLGLTFIYAGLQKLTDSGFLDPALPVTLASNCSALCGRARRSRL